MATWLSDGDWAGTDSLSIRARLHLWRPVQSDPIRTGHNIFLASADCDAHGLLENRGESNCFAFVDHYRCCSQHLFIPTYVFHMETIFIAMEFMAYFSHFNQLVCFVSSLTLWTVNKCRSGEKWWPQWDIAHAGIDFQCSTLNQDILLQ